MKNSEKSCVWDIFLSVLSAIHCFKESYETAKFLNLPENNYSVSQLPVTPKNMVN